MISSLHMNAILYKKLSTIVARFIFENSSLWYFLLQVWTNYIAIILRLSHFRQLRVAFIPSIRNKCCEFSVNLSAYFQNVHWPSINVCILQAFEFDHEKLNIFKKCDKKNHKLAFWKLIDGHFLQIDTIRWKKLATIASGLKMLHDPSSGENS